AKDSLYLSLPPVQLTGLVIPGHPSTVEWILYPGAFCFLLAFLSITFFRKNRDLWFWSLVALLCLLWALGENVAWNKTLITLPVLNLLRVPARGVYFLSVAFLMMSVTCLDRLLRSNPEKAVFLRLGSIGVAVLVLLVQGFVAFSNPDKNLFIVYHMVCWAVMTVLILLYSYRKISMISFVITLGIVGILDIGYVDFRLINTRTSQNAFTDGGDFGDALIEKGNDFRSFSASYSISQQTAAFRDLELSDGIDPMQLISYSNFIRESTGSSVDGYSVTLPEFRNGKPELDNFGVKPSALKFSLLNVRYLVSAFPIDEEGWVEEEFQESGFLYRNDLARGWAWIEPSLGSGVKDYDSVSQVVRTNNQIRVLAEGPGFLHISEIDYPGWQATVDGKPARIHKAYGVIRAVEVEEGLHNVTMIFRPVRVFYGVLISLMTVGLGLVMLEKNKHRWLISAVLVIFVVTSIPYLMGYFFQETDWRFTGFLFGVEDGNSYIAKMLSGTFGNWLFRSPFSTLSQSGVLAFFPYILLGKLASPPALHDQLVVLFQIFRFFASGLLIWATYSFVSLFIISPAYKKLATLVILIGGGLGWLGWVFIPDDGSWRLPLEVYSPEAFGFLSIVGLPHLAAARALLLLGFTGFIKQINTGFRFSSMWKSGMFWLAAGFFQPLTLAVGCVVLTVTVLFIYLFSDIHRENQGLPLIKRALFMGAAASPWIVYNLLFFSSDAYLVEWYKQNIISSPPLYDYLWSFGVYLMAAIPAILKIFKEKVQNAMILPAWVMCASILAYVPYNLQRRFIEGVWVAIVVLIFLSLEMIKDRRWHIGYSSLITTTCIAPLLVLMTLSQGVMRIDLPVYRPSSEVKMFEYLAKVAEPGDTVLCSYETGNALPAWAPVFVLAGHGPESANLEAVIIDIEKFYSRESTMEWRNGFILRNSVDFMILGPEEKKSVPSSFVLEDVFQPIYDDQNYQVFKVVSGWNE
ncbi:MAG: YfhO family protein, partial [Leptolinea sp.]|nr:YfhO family protein [Leptolinea sp.]